MGTYISSADLTARYDILASWSDVDNTLIVYAEAELNQYLAPYFTVPFSPVSLSIKDITMDLAYCKSLRSKDPGKATDVCSGVYSRIEQMQLEGFATDSGTVISPSDATNEVYSTTEDYVMTHSMLDAESPSTHVDSNMQQDMISERD